MQLMRYLLLAITVGLLVLNVATAQACDPNYPDVCIPPAPPDLDCRDIEFKNFRVLPADPHHFDGDDDGIGCEIPPRVS